MSVFWVEDFSSIILHCLSHIWFYCESNVDPVNKSMLRPPYYVIVKFVLVNEPDHVVKMILGVLSIGFNIHVPWSLR
jgi:hypothetical protein